MTTDEFAIAHSWWSAPSASSGRLRQRRYGESRARMSLRSTGHRERSHLEAQAVFMPNPHAVAFVDDLQEPGPLDSA